MTPEGLETRQRLYQTALALIAEKGYEATTLREVAERAEVSVGLLYRYFPSKRAVVLALYDELSADYANRAGAMPPGKWRDRFLFAVETSLSVLRPHRTTLKALAPILVSDPEEGLFAEKTAFSRLRVQKVFQRAVAAASDAPSDKVSDALASWLYMAHLAMILWWLLDKSPHQRATTGLVTLLRQMLPPLTVALKLRPVRGFLVQAGGLLGDALQVATLPRQSELKL